MHKKSVRKIHRCVEIFIFYHGWCIIRCRWIHMLNHMPPVVRVISFFRHFDYKHFADLDFQLNTRSWVEKHEYWTWIERWRQSKLIMDCTFNGFSYSWMLFQAVERWKELFVLMRDSPRYLSRKSLVLTRKRLELHLNTQHGNFKAKWVFTTIVKGSRKRFYQRRKITSCSLDDHWCYHLVLKLSTMRISDSLVWMIKLWFHADKRVGVDNLSFEVALRGSKFFTHWKWNFKLAEDLKCLFWGVN